MDDTGFGKRIISYPTNAFIVYLAVREKRLKFHYPFEYIHTSYESLQNEAAAFSEAFTSRGYAIDRECIVLPIAYQEAVPLKKEYWQDSEHLPFYKTTERYRSFISLLITPDFFRVLITPRGRSESSELLSAAIPIPVSRITKSIEHFMFGSDYPVDEEAKNAALYIPGKPYAVNWKQKTVVALPQLPSERGAVN